MIESSLHQSEPVLLPDRSIGRVVRSVIGYALLTAIMIVFAMPVFVPAALWHCAMRNGRRAGVAALALAGALSILSIVATPGTPAVAQLVWSYVIGVLVAVGIPSIAVQPMLERGQSFARVLVMLLIGAALGLIATELGIRAVASFSPKAVHAAQSQQATTQLAEAYRASGVPSDAVRFVRQWGGYYSTTLLPAGMLLSAAVSFFLSLLLTGRLKAWRERGTAGGGGMLFRNFALPEWLLFAFVFGGLAPLAHGFLQNVAANVLTVVVFLYVLQGFALLRFLLAAVGVGFLGALIGSMLVIFSGVGPLLLGVAGLFDPFFDFRHFKKRKDDSHESHSD